ncbi:DUF1491 family protein [Stappia sp. F7233]|uniref:DUF1491 family protein n=1 Tax=Stappia albiluteola TaxID=2758565 RepID=A0A839AJ05_9HYPH|nr:DUF1491 family protein [Stappia albiluteola]MBA5779046.1 DUF1491 family protein [Stappia albiluteola]
MRLTSDFWVGAHVRRCFAEGAYAVVRRRGAREAGAIFLVVDRLDGTYDLYGPAPQTMLIDADTGGRLFERLQEKCDRETVEARFVREARIDPDFWVVEIEDRNGRAYLDMD